MASTFVPYGGSIYGGTFTDNSWSGSIRYVSSTTTTVAPPAKPKPDGPLEWLDRRVEEVCEMAFELVPA